MADRADFTVRLIDKITGPGRRAKAALRGLRQEASKSSGELKKGNQTYRDTAGRLRDLGGRFKSAGAAAGRSARGFSLFRGSLAHLGGNLMTSAVHGLGRLAVGLGETAIEFATFSQNSRFTFSKLAKEGASPEKLFQHSMDLAEQFGLSLKDTSKQYGKFLALQFNPQQADDLIALGSDLRTLGASAEEVQGTFLALGQIKSKGRLQGEELLQLQERGVSGELIKKAIAQRTGIELGQVDKAISAGKISSEVGLGAIQDAILGKLGTSKPGEAGEEFANKTIEGVVGKLKAKAARAAVGFGDKFAPALQRVGNKALEVFTRFTESSTGSRMADGIAVAFVAIADAVTIALPYVSSFVEAFGSGFSDAIGPLKEAILPLLSGGEAGSVFAGTVKTLGKQLGRVAAVALAVGGVFAGLTSAMVAVSTAVYEVSFAIVSNLFSGLTTAIGKLVLWWDNIAAVWRSGGDSFFEKAIETGGYIVDGLLQGLKAAPGKLLDYVRTLGLDVAKAFKDSLGISSPSKIFASAGVDTVAGFQVGFGREMRSTNALVASAGLDLGSKFTSSASAGFKADAFRTDLAFASGSDTERFQAELGFSAPMPSRPAFDDRIPAAPAAAAPMSMRGSSGGHPITVHIDSINVNAGQATDAPSIAQTIGVDVRRELARVLSDINDR